MKIEESIIINRRPEDVFAFLEVRSNDATWMAAVVESEWLDGQRRTCRRRSVSVAAVECS